MSNDSKKRKRGDSKGDSTELIDGVNVSDSPAFSLIEPCAVFEIIIKEDKKASWMVHESTLRANAPAMMAGFENARKRRTKTLQSTLDAPLRCKISGYGKRVVGMFVHWLYHQKIPTEIENNYEIVTITKLWVLGETLNATALQNTAMHSLFRMFRHRDKFTWDSFMKVLNYLQEKYGNFEAGENILWDFSIAAFVRNGGQKLVDRNDGFPAVQKVVALTMMNLDNSEQLLQQKTNVFPPLAKFLVDQEENLEE